MDLKGIDAWTREALEQEARRRGIIDAELRPRRELIRLIVQSGYSRAVSQGARRIARGLKGIDQARDLLSIAMETAAELRERLPLPGRTGRTLVGMPTPLHGAPPQRTPTDAGKSAGTDAGAGAVTDASTSTRTSTGAVTDTDAGTSTSTRTSTSTGADTDAGTDTGAVTAAGANAGTSTSTRTDAGTDTGTDTDAVTDGAPGTGTAPRTAPAPATVTLESRSAATELTAGPSVAERVGGRAPSAAREPVREPATHSFVDEPIRTHSMARLLAAQGHTERAIAIYEELLAQNSEAPGLAQELEALRRGEPAAEPLARLPEPPPVTPADTGDRVRCEREGDDGLELSWTISEAGQARARALLGGEGELTVRLVRICPDSERVVRSEITEHGPIAAAGRWHTTGASAGERWVAAVGLRTGGRFVSIAHTRP